MVIHAFVRFCLVLNSYFCQELEIAPADHAIASQGECGKGVMMGNTSEFTYLNARWHIVGGGCRAVPNETEAIQHHLRTAVRP